MTTGSPYISAIEAVALIEAHSATTNARDEFLTALKDGALHAKGIRRKLDLSDDGVLGPLGVNSDFSEDTMDPISPDWWVFSKIEWREKNAVLTREAPESHGSVLWVIGRVRVHREDVMRHWAVSGECEHSANQTEDKEISGEEKTKVGRPKGSGEIDDTENLNRMSELISSGQSRSIHAAASIIAAERIEGELEAVEEDSVRKRLIKKAQRKLKKQG